MGPVARVIMSMTKARPVHFWTIQSLNSTVNIEMETKKRRLFRTQEAKHNKMATLAKIYLTLSEKRIWKTARSLQIILHG